MASLSLHNVKKIIVTDCNQVQSDVVGPYSVRRVTVLTTGGTFTINFYGGPCGIPILSEKSTDTVDEQAVIDKATGKI